MRCAREIGGGSRGALPLRVDRVVDDGDVTRALYCTDVEGTELRVAVRGLPGADPSWESNRWYRFDGVVRSTSPGAELLFPAGVGSTERIDAPERRAYPPSADLDDPWLTQLGASDDVVVLTVQPRPTDGSRSPRADAPESFEVGAVCFAYPDGAGDTTVYHREEPDTHDEHLLLQHVVRDLSEAEGATLVTHGADRSPLGMLRTRLALAAEGDTVEAGAGRVLDGCFHADTGSLATRAGAETLTAAARRLGVEHSPVRLDDYDIGLDPADWREGWETDEMSLSGVADPRMTDRDYATLVERYLRADEELATTELGGCLKAHASAELPLLGELATHEDTGCLACPRLSGRLPPGNRSA